MLWWSKKLNSTKGGADFPLVQCQLYFIRQIYFLITCHERFIKMPSIWWCNLFICSFTTRVTICRQSGVATFYHMHYSRTSILLPSIRIIECFITYFILERVSPTPSIRISNHCHCQPNAFDSYYLHLQCPI